MASERILVVDDDRSVLKTLKACLESAGFGVIIATGEHDALFAAQSDAFDLAILDMQLQGFDGIELMRELRDMFPGMPVIILTGFGTIESAVLAMSQGAFSFLTKPVNMQQLLSSVEKALKNRRLTIAKADEVPEDGKGEPVKMIAKSGKMVQILDTVSRIAGNNSTVYIYGESGTGKELVAKAIHSASPRKEKPFIAVNCAAIPESLLESHLFGHEKGAFTGAVQTVRGVFSQAHGGTIFLDEIGEMRPATQAKLLRVLQERSFYPLGSERLVRVDVRVIVATNKDLMEAVKKGSFRDDLFYRIHVIPIYIPPLRERREDIPPLVEYFVARLNGRTGRNIREVTAGAMARLMAHEWRGNVRELENTVEYAAAMTKDDAISEEYVIPPQRQSEDGKPISFKDARSLFEKKYLTRVLQVCNGNVAEAAEVAGKCRTDFYDLLKKHLVDPREFRQSSR